MASHPTRKLFEAVLELDVELQEALVQALLARLAERRAPAGVNAAWKREVRGRARAVLAGRAELVDAETVAREVSQAIAVARRGRGAPAKKRRAAR